MSAPTIPTPWWKTYASVAAAIDCKAVDPSGRGRHAIGIQPSATGTAVLRHVGGSVGTDETVYLLAGVPFYGEFDQIVSGTATNFVIYWDR